MTMTRTGTVLGWLAALVLPLLAASGVRAQMWLYPVYGPMGVYYVPYSPVSPGPLSPPAVSASRSQPAPLVRTSATSTPAYAAPANDSDARPSYYSEDYTGPQGPTKEPSKVAYIRVRVPANAELWINNEKRTQAGTVREFVTPALDPDHIYVYNVKAHWTEEGGINVEKTLRVRTISGTRVTASERGNARRRRAAATRRAARRAAPGRLDLQRRSPVVPPRKSLTSFHHRDDGGRGEGEQRGPPASITEARALNRRPQNPYSWSASRREG
jgi:uncharacterized protein (TIGR03000 family)